MAIFRREFDEDKYPQKSPINRTKGLVITPNRVLNFISIMAILVFITYLAIQYFSILSAPKLKIASPPDDFSTPTPVIVVMGKTDKDASVSVDGQFVPVDSEGNFSYQVTLDQGQNIIEITASKRLSPKARVTRVVRLTR